MIKPSLEKLLSPTKLIGRRFGVKISILTLKIHPICCITRDRAKYAGLSFCIFFFLSFSQNLYPSCANITHFSALTSVALGPVTPVTCTVPGLPPSPPPPSWPWASDRSRLSFWPLLTGSQGHFLLPLLWHLVYLSRIVTEIVSAQRYLSGHRCLPQCHCGVSLLGLTLGLRLPPPSPSFHLAEDSLP